MQRSVIPCANSLVVSKGGIAAWRKRKMTEVDSHWSRLGGDDSLWEGWPRVIAHADMDAFYADD